jgi:hypothetical protein
MSRLYRRFIRRDEHFDDVLYACKKRLASEMNPRPRKGHGCLEGIHLINEHRHYRAPIQQYNCRLLEGYPFWLRGHFGSRKRDRSNVREAGSQRAKILRCDPRATQQRQDPGGFGRPAGDVAPCRPSGEPCSAKTCREILQPPIVPQATWSAPLPLFHCSSEIAPSRSTSCRSAHPQNSPNQGRVAKVGLNHKRRPKSIAGHITYARRVPQSTTHGGFKMPLRKVSLRNPAGSENPAVSPWLSQLI